MAPLIPSAKAILSYPLYACDFDPLDSSRLVVGGGGGAGRTGVGNKITLFNTSKPTELEEIAEIDLSKDEDNVTSLAVGPRKEDATLLFAGINSSPKDLEKGENQHFRVFGIEAKGKGKAGAKKLSASQISEVSRSKLFDKTEKDSYQRIVRLSKPYPNQPQLGAIATGLAQDSEIVLFDTSAISPPNSRGALQLNKEAEDMDILQTGDNEYLFAYCDMYDVYVKKISAKSNAEEPQEVYVTPASRGHEKVTLPKFRSLRWLTKDFILMLTNIHSNGGVVLQVLRLPPSGKGHCRIVQSHRLPSNISKATGLAVCNLTPPVSPTAKQGYTQTVFAVAGHDRSISLFKMDIQYSASVYLSTKIKPFRTFKNVHPLQITGVAFSNPTPPAQPITASTPPQYLKLASIGVSNTVVVHTLPLFPVPLSVNRGQSETPRYVVALPSSATTFGMGIVVSIIGTLLAAILVQSVLEIRGGVKPFLNATNYIPVTWQEALGKPYIFPSDYGQTPPSAPLHSHDHLHEFFDKLGLQQSKVKHGEGVVIIDHTPEGKEVLNARVHDEAAHGPHGGKSWDDLGHEQKAQWKKVFKDAGYWAEDMEETIFKGVLFGELAGAVGQAISGA